MSKGAITYVIIIYIKITYKYLIFVIPMLQYNWVVIYGTSTFWTWPRVHFGRGYIYCIQYHVVWCVKYRHNVLNDKIEQSLSEILHKIAAENGFTILEVNGDLDYIHLFIECTPQHYIPNIIKALKGVSARLLLKQYPELKTKLWGGHLWNPSYFVSTVSENTEEHIRNYINSQKQR